MRARLVAVLTAVALVGLMAAGGAAQARPTILKPFLSPVLNPLQAFDRGLLDIDKDRAGALEELLLEGCNAFNKVDTDGGGVIDGVEIDRGTDCLNPADDEEPTEDADDDGFPVPEDCDDHDPDINPGAVDLPDVDAIDANCDEFDGDPATGVFVAPTGDDANPGTREQPKRTVQAAIDAGFSDGKEVFLDAAIYADDNPAGVTLKDGVNLYGGYRAADNWERRSLPALTRIEGSPQAAQAAGVTAEVQLLEFRGTADGNRSSYGVRAIDGSNLTFRRVRIRGRDGIEGVRGAHGRAGRDGTGGEAGETGEEDGDAGAGGAPGAQFGFAGGAGGHGGQDYHDGEFGLQGLGGDGGNPGRGGFKSNCGEAEPGVAGFPGLGGLIGLPGSGGTDSLAQAGAFFVSVPATAGNDGTNASGGGGGGGGGGHGDAPANPPNDLCDDGGGGGGGGGGAGGEAGLKGQPGSPGGASFGLYLFNATAAVLDGSAVISGAGGNGGRGGDGGPGGDGGEGGTGGAVDGEDEVGEGGKGGDGGKGGHGGSGGGGAGGPSAAIGQFGGSTATVADSTLTHGLGGRGGGSADGGAATGADGRAADRLP